MIKLNDPEFPSENLCDNSSVFLSNHMITFPFTACTVRCCNDAERWYLHFLQITIKFLKMFTTQKFCWTEFFAKPKVCWQLGASDSTPTVSLNWMFCWNEIMNHFRFIWHYAKSLVELNICWSQISGEGCGNYFASIHSDKQNTCCSEEKELTNHQKHTTTHNAHLKVSQNKMINRTIQIINVAENNTKNWKNKTNIFWIS